MTTLTEDWGTCARRPILHLRVSTRPPYQDPDRACATLMRNTYAQHLLSALDEDGRLETRRSAVIALAAAGPDADERRVHPPSTMSKLGLCCRDCNRRLPLAPAASAMGTTAAPAAIHTRQYLLVRPRERLEGAGVGETRAFDDLRVRLAL